MQEGSPHLPVQVAAEYDAVAFLGEAHHTITPASAQERGCMTFGAIASGSIAVSMLAAPLVPWAIALVPLLLACYFAYGALTRLWAVDVHERGLVWRTRRQRRQMPFDHIASFQESSGGIIVDGGDELFIVNALSYSEAHRRHIVEALRVAIPERERTPDAPPR